MERMVQDCATWFNDNVFYLSGDSFGPCIFQLSSFILKFYIRKFHVDFVVLVRILRVSFRELLHS